MFKKLLSIAVLSFLALGVNAQEEKKFYIGLNLGGSMASGDIANTTIDFKSDNLSGFSKYGAKYGLVFGYNFHDYVGAHGIYNSFMTFPDATAYQTAAKEAYKTPAQNVSQAEITYSPHATNVLAVGPKGRIKAGNVEFYIAPLVGYAFANPVVVTERLTFVSSTGATPNADFESKTSTYTYGAGLAYGASIGLRTGITKRVSFLTDFNFMSLGSRSVTGSYTATRNSGSLTSNPKSDLKSSASFITLNFGFTVNF